MKVAGALALVVGFIAALLLLVLPTSVRVLGTDTSCDIPVKGMFGYEAGSDPYLADQCQKQSVIRVSIGAVVGVTAMFAGGLMLALGPSAADKERDEFERWQRWQNEQERQQWERQQWERQPRPEPWRNLPPPQQPPAGY